MVAPVDKVWFGTGGKRTGLGLKGQRDQERERWEEKALFVCENLFN